MAPIVCSAAQATFFAMPNQFDLVAFDSPKEIPVHTSLAAALKPLRGHKQVGVHTNPAAAFIKPPRALRRFLCTRALLQPSDLCEAPGKSVCTRALLQLSDSCEALGKSVCTRALLQLSNLCEATSKSVCTRALLQLSDLCEAPGKSVACTHFLWNVGGMLGLAPTIQQKWSWVGAKRGPQRPTNVHRQGAKLRTSKTAAKIKAQCY